MRGHGTGARGGIETRFSRKSSLMLTTNKLMLEVYRRRASDRHTFLTYINQEDYHQVLSKLLQSAVAVTDAVVQSLRRGRLCSARYEKIEIAT